MKVHLAKINFVIVQLVTKIVVIGKAFIMKNMKGYYDLYLKRNVLILTCVFEIFRIETIISFELDPTHYIFLLLVIAEMQFKGLQISI